MLLPGAGPACLTDGISSSSHSQGQPQVALARAQGASPLLQGGVHACRSRNLAPSPFGMEFLNSPPAIPPPQMSLAVVATTVFHPTPTAQPRNVYSHASPRRGRAARAPPARGPLRRAHRSSALPAWWRACTALAKESLSPGTRLRRAHAEAVGRGLLGAQAKGCWLLRRGFASCERKWPRYNTRAPA